MKPELLKKVELWLNTWRSFIWGLITSLTVGLVYEWANILAVLKNWETLLGSMIGALLPVLVAILWNPTANKIKKYEALKESLREIEIETTQIINDICDIRSIYFGFIKNIHDLVDVSKKDEKIGPLLFSAPPKIYVYKNPQLLKYKTGSIYLHNTLIGLNKWTLQINAVLDNIGENTQDIQKSFGDRFHKLPNTAPRTDFNDIKDNYNKELLRFAGELSSIEETFNNGLEAAVIAKVCGQKMNNWNRSFVYSVFLKRFDAGYQAFLSAEKNSDSELTLSMHESVYPVVKEDVEAMTKKIKAAMKD